MVEPGRGVTTVHVTWGERPKGHLYVSHNAQTLLKGLRLWNYKQGLEALEMHGTCLSLCMPMTLKKSSPE